jgi:cell division protein FtsB
MRILKRSMFFTAPLLLGACVGAVPGAYTDAKAGFAAVSAQTAAAIGKQTAFAQTQAENDALKRQVQDMVKGKRIGADTAVQAALFNNKGLQAAYANVGLSATHGSNPPLKTPWFPLAFWG